MFRYLDMFIRRKKRQSRKGTVWDFYVVESQRPAGGDPRLKVLGYIGCIRESLLHDPNEQRFFWKSSPATTFSQEHKGAREKIEEILASHGILSPNTVKHLVQLAEGYVPKPKLRKKM